MYATIEICLAQFRDSWCGKDNLFKIHVSIRNERVTAKSNVELLTISGEDFRGALLESTSNEIKENMDCIRKNPLFSTWKDAQLLEVCKSLTAQKYRGNEIVCWQGAPAFCVHLIKDGSCRVVKEIRKPQQIFHASYDSSATARLVSLRFVYNPLVMCFLI